MKELEERGRGKEGGIWKTINEGTGREESRRVWDIE